jgi:hypothetical protein
MGDNKIMQRTSREGWLAPAGLSPISTLEQGVGQRGQAQPSLLVLFKGHSSFISLSAYTIV